MSKHGTQHTENDASSHRKNVSFANQNRLTNLNEFLKVLTSRSNGASNSATNRFGFTNDELTLMCPVSLHQRIIFDKHDVECRCRKQTVPFIHDVEFDFLMKLVPSDQTIIVVIVDS